VFVDDPSAGNLVRGTVRRTQRAAWSVRLDLERSDGSKLGSRIIVTRAPDCSALDDSLALALGLMLDLTERPAEERQSAETAHPPESASITIPTETAAPRTPWRFEPTLGGEGALGLLPGFAFGARFAVAAEPPRLWRIEAGATLWQQRTTGAEPGVRFSMWTVDVAVCPFDLEGRDVIAWACLAQRAGQIRSEGIGFDKKLAPEETLLAAEARLGATWTFAEPFAVHAALGLDAPLVQLRFVYRDAQGDIASVHKMPPVAGTLALGIGARF
jgi:hypothetical protein